MSGRLDDDFVVALTRQLAAVAPELPPARWIEIAELIRQDWGGSRPYIRKAPAETGRRAISKAQNLGMTLQQAFAAAAVSRSSGYRLIKRK